MFPFRNKVGLGEDAITFEPASPNKPAAVSEDDVAPDVMLHLSAPVEKAILEAGHASRIASVDSAMMASHSKARLLIVTVSLVPKSEKSWEGIVHYGFIVESKRNGPITVYTTGGSDISDNEIFSNWMENSGYKFPLGRGMEKVLEINPKP